MILCLSAFASIPITATASSISILQHSAFWSTCQVKKKNTATGIPISYFYSLSDGYHIQLILSVQYYMKKKYKTVQEKDTTTARLLF